MKNALLTLAIITSLSACTAGPSGVSLNLGLGGLIGSHVGLGTSISIPIRTTPTPTTEATTIETTDNQTLAYFDAHGKQSDSAVKGGFYRQLVSKRSDNEYIVQDFYSDGKKRTDPMTLSRDNLFVFDTHPSDGTLTVYSSTGALMQQQVYQNNLPVKK